MATQRVVTCEGSKYSKYFVKECRVFEGNRGFQSGYEMYGGVN